MDWNERTWAYEWDAPVGRKLQTRVVTSSDRLLYLFPSSCLCNVTVNKLATYYARRSAFAKDTGESFVSGVMAHDVGTVAACHAANFLSSRCISLEVLHLKEREY